MFPLSAQSWNHGGKSLIVPFLSSLHMQRREDSSPVDINLVASVGVVDEVEAVSAVAFVVAIVMATMSAVRSCPVSRVVGV